jgi:hypothetical protein
MTYAVDATPPFYHRTRADLNPGDLIAACYSSNYRERSNVLGLSDRHAGGVDLGRRAGRRLKWDLAAEQKKEVSPNR